MTPLHRGLDARTKRVGHPQRRVSSQELLACCTLTPNFCVSKEPLSHVTCWFLWQGPIRSPENWSWLAYIALQGSLFGQHHFRKWYCPLKRGQYHIRRWYCPLFFFFFFFFFVRRKAGTAVKEMCSVCFYRQRVDEGDEGDFNPRKAAQRVLPWQGAEQRSFANVELHCNYVELWFLVKAEWRTQNKSGVSAISFWPFEGRRVGSRKRSSRRAFEIAQSKTEAIAEGAQSSALIYYSQTWELRPPKGLGVSGPILQVVSFARFGSKNFNMELYTCPCASHDISDRWFPRVSGGVIGNGLAKRNLQNAFEHLIRIFRF